MVGGPAGGVMPRGLVGISVPGMTWETYLPCGGDGVSWMVVGWSLVENCTVDASIFVFCG